MVAFIGLEDMSLQELFLLQRQLGKQIERKVKELGL